MPSRLRAETPCPPSPKLCPGWGGFGSATRLSSDWCDSPLILPASSSLLRFVGGGDMVVQAPGGHGGARAPRPQLHLSKKCCVREPGKPPPPLRELAWRIPPHATQHWAYAAAGIDGRIPPRATHYSANAAPRVDGRMPPRATHHWANAAAMVDWRMPPGRCDHGRGWRERGGGSKRDIFQRPKRRLCFFCLGGRRRLHQSFFLWCFFAWAEGVGAAFLRAVSTSTPPPFIPTSTPAPHP